MVLTAKGYATRDRIIEGAAEHMRTNALGEITLDEVRLVTGTSKGQLFHYFPGGKEELLLAVMRHEADRVLADQQPHIGDLSSWSAWERWRERVIARYREQGTHCPLNSLIGQIGSTPGADDVTRALFARWQAHLVAGITTMQRSGEISADMSAEHAAAALVAGIQGGVVVMWSTGTTEHLEAVLDLLFERLRGRRS